MYNKKKVSPFERAAAREGMYFRGGVCSLSSYPLPCLLMLFLLNLRKSTSKLYKVFRPFQDIDLPNSVTVVVGLVRETL